MDKVDVYLQLGENGKEPLYATEGSAGCDVFAACDAAILPGETAVVPLNIYLALPEGYEAQIRPRSGLSLKTSLRTANAPGTIDSDYRDEIGVILENTFDDNWLFTQMKKNSDIWQKLKKEYTRISLAEYLQIPEYPSGDIWVDEKGYPYGTVFLKKGERIAQMVIAEVKSVHFIQHGSVGKIGQDRGGGFGHTGK